MGDVNAHYSESLDDLATYIDPADPWHERFSEARSNLLPSGTHDHDRYGRIQRTVTSSSEGEMSADEIPLAIRHVGIVTSIILSSKCQKVARMGLMTGDRESSRPRTSTSP